MSDATGQRVREYSEVVVPAGDGAREARMQALVWSLWEVLGDQGVSWVGFYLGPGQSLEDGRVVGDDEMLLGPNRPKPACSPIGLHGVCGECWRRGEAIVVRDVKDLGEAYVACDPLDASEVVVPLLDESGACWGALDLDSREVGAFDQRDARELANLCARAGLSARR